VLLLYTLLIALDPRVAAQTQAQLSIQTYAGLTITGAVGTVYSIEYISDILQTNNPAAWRSLEFLQLTGSPHFWVDKSAPVQENRFYRAREFAAPGRLVFIPPGTFRMGSLASESDRYGQTESPATMVIISQGFWMGSYEVTQGEYLAVAGTNPSHFSDDTNRPVESVTWHEATNYCALRTQRERAAGGIPANCGYRLPTEAEWEYACRAWTSTRFSHGDDPGYTNLTSYAWYSDNSGGTTHPVGQKAPNLWGLSEMHGNVWEWCQDRWSEKLPGGTVVDPRGPLVGSDQVLRGGSWYLDGKWCRTAYRMGLPPTRRLDDFGFRVVLAQMQP
jgi:formylglycine-generating enzyme required for sulfatase activity